ncbi:hypothetical protein Trco_003349 [Trichoderma cornu-damae]|uniref:Zn(2)-C6 fungal-type domain-containing protein n=1 Tax=Trichoderma cornu-damae TaxID=654480 RepID=A0A9P8QKW6_9HYPO|nr:hypothetical protein Trco_003349 [Trichoderma cornu-damae]
MSAISAHTTREFKQRRSHEKSRRGCTRCKKQRKKCDEVRPTCSRCNKRNHCCRYTVQNERFRSESTDNSPGQDELTSEIPDIGYSNLPKASPSSSEARSNPICSSDSGIVSVPSYLTPGRSERLRPPSALSSEELELLSHYITHTSRAIPYDEDDLYALHVGFPNLAFRSGPVMGSILALSAVCKCYDIVTQSPSPLDRLAEIKQLLILADQRHRTSLHQLQAAIYDNHCDTVLANAALMVLYALSGHWVRVLLAKKAKRGGKILSNEMLPLQSQWITSIRAAYVAYVGLLNSTCSDGKDESMSVPSDVTNDIPLPTTTLLGENLFFPQDGPSEGTKQLLLPIVSATYMTALAKLDVRAQSLWLEDGALTIIQTRKASTSELQACLASLGLLEELFAKVFASNPSEPELPQSPCPTTGSSHLGRLDRASPWLRHYLARVTSAKPSKLWRRTIMAFVNRVPLEYLQLVQSALDYMPLAAKQPASNSLGKILPLGAAQHLAINIFAHWLVLVMLLDGVWWIGRIGQWELGRILSFAEAEYWIPESAGTGEAWWPESMYAVQNTIGQPIE